MREIVIFIPEVDPCQNIEIDVRINGKKRTLQYRVEIVEWEGDDPSADRVDILRRKIQAYDKDWRLMEIGAPANHRIPLTFRKKKPEAG